MYLGTGFMEMLLSTLCPVKLSPYLTLLPFSKVFESVIIDEVVKHFTSGQILSDKQYVFCLASSTTYVVNTITEFLCHGLDEYDEARSMVLDI